MLWSLEQLTFWFWPECALRIQLRSPSLRYVIVTNDQVVLLPVQNTPTISFAKVLDLAVDTESRRLVALGRHVTARPLDVDRSTGKVLVPSSAVVDRLLLCTLQELPDVVRQDEIRLRFFVIVLILRCLSVNVVASDPAQQTIRVRLRGHLLNFRYRHLDLEAESSIDFSFDGCEFSQKLAATTDMAMRFKELQAFLDYCKSRLHSKI